MSLKFQSESLSPRLSIKSVKPADIHPFLADRESERPLSISTSCRPPSRDPILESGLDDYRPCKKPIHAPWQSKNVALSSDEPAAYRPIKRPVPNPIDLSAAGVSSYLENVKTERFLKKQIHPVTPDDKPYKPIRKMVPQNYTDPISVASEEVTRPRSANPNYLRHTSRSESEVIPKRVRTNTPQISVTQCFSSTSPSISPRHNIKVFSQRNKASSEDVLKYQYHGGIMNEQRPLSKQEQREVLTNATKNIAEENTKVRQLCRARLESSNIIFG
ncbi:hypothetical protein RCL1_001540 [Eukaryota sp. TZLM3-RCL]